MLNRSLHRLHVLALYTLITGVAYHVWLLFVIDSTIGVVFFCLELAMFLLAVLFSINHWNRRYVLSGGAYSFRSIVDIYISIKGEPVGILEKTLKAATEIDYPNTRIYILDDGARPRVRQLAEKYGATHVVRGNRKKKQYKAANFNNALSRSYGNFILALDVDQVPQPNILDDVLGHFSDEQVGLVTTRQRFVVNSDDFNNDHLFYEYMQSGKNADHAGISCGSGVIYRRSALDAIGGFPEWNLLEDLYTSYVLNTRGYRTVYVNQSYTKGIAPHNLRTIYKQRGNWALDTLRLFFWKMPFLNLRLPWRQRLHYFELGYIYLVSAVVLPSLYALNFYSLLSNQPILSVGLSFVFFKFISFYFILKMYNELGQGSSSSRMWAALFPVYLKAAVQALLYFKPRYQVTEKVIEQPHASRLQIHLVIPQMLVILLGSFAVAYHGAYFGFTTTFIVNAFWLIVMLYWLVPVFPKAIHEQKEQTVTHSYARVKKTI